MRQLVTLFILGILVGGSTKSALPPKGIPTPLELDTLRVKGNIYEPQVLYILEQPSIDLITTQEKKGHDFLQDYQQPLLEQLY